MLFRSSWLEHTPDKGEVDGPSPFEPTTRKGDGLKGAARIAMNPCAEQTESDFRRGVNEDSQLHSKEVLYYGK